MGGGNFLKKWPKKEVPLFWALVGDFGISSENGVQSWPPRESKLAEKTVCHPSGVISEVLRRVDFALPACLGPKIDPREHL